MILCISFIILLIHTSLGNGAAFGMIGEMIDFHLCLKFSYIFGKRKIKYFHDDLL